MLTAAFEFLFGHVDKKSWDELFGNSDITSGNLWLLVLAWIAVGPAVVRAVRRRA